jgi:hypothetical protein
MIIVDVGVMAAGRYHAPKQNRNSLTSQKPANRPAYVRAAFGGWFLSKFLDTAL